VSPLSGQPVLVVAAGGISDGRGLAASLSYGAAGVWVGTRFVASTEAGASERHKQALLEAGWDDIIRTTVFSGRPMNVRKTGYLEEWEGKRRGEMLGLQKEGLIPHEVEEERNPERAHKLGAKRKWSTLLSHCSVDIYLSQC
jgi:NAD(P)H-dependent flavin oxidoreductase YrpB (nitropropane dioxygenase family)